MISYLSIFTIYSISVAVCIPISILILMFSYDSPNQPKGFFGNPIIRGIILSLILPIALAILVTGGIIVFPYLLITAIYNITKSQKPKPEQL